MSGRGATTAFLTEAAKLRAAEVHLFELYLDTGIIYATDAFTQLIYNNNTYIADGNFLTFDQVQETGDLSGASTSVTLSGVSQVYIAEVLQNVYIDRRLIIRKAYLADNMAVIDPLPILDGRIDQPVIAEDPTTGLCTITLTVGSHWVDFERKAGRHTNDAEQQLFFPGDTGFRLVGATRDDIKWGTK